MRRRPGRHIGIEEGLERRVDDHAAEVDVLGSAGHHYVVMEAASVPAHGRVHGPGDKALSGEGGERGMVFEGNERLDVTGTRAGEGTGDRLQPPRSGRRVGVGGDQSAVAAGAVEVGVHLEATVGGGEEDVWRVQRVEPAAAVGEVCVEAAADEGRRFDYF